MPYHATSLKLTCDYRKCKVQILVDPKEEALSFTALLAIATERGWWTDPGSNKCMCPTCVKVSEMNYQKKLDKEKKKKESVEL